MLFLMGISGKRLSYVTYVALWFKKIPLINVVVNVVDEYIITSLKIFFSLALWKPQHCLIIMEIL